MFYVTQDTFAALLTILGGGLYFKKLKQKRKRKGRAGRFEKLDAKGGSN